MCTVGLPALCHCIQRGCNLKLNTDKKCKGISQRYLPGKVLCATLKKEWLAGCSWFAVTRSFKAASEALWSIHLFTSAAASASAGFWSFWKTMAIICKQREA